jgi:hypothetical protein
MYWAEILESQKTRLKAPWEAYLDRSLTLSQPHKQALWRGCHTSWDFTVAKTQDMALRFRNSIFDFLGKELP